MFNKLYKYYSEGLVIKNEHPRLPLIIWNYSDRVQYQNLWDKDKFLYDCRGLITDTKGNLIAKSFPKFFNYNEIENKTNIPWKDKYVLLQDKIDGSLGILFNYNREWILSTKGSFVSEQSIKGYELLKEQFDLTKFDPNFTYMIEIVYPENRIVVNYEKSFITFLSIFYKDEELDWNESKILLKLFGVKDENIVETKSYKSISPEIVDNLRKQNIKNKEGYVFRFLPTNFRFKLKFEEYLRLHKLYSNISNITVWQNLKEGKKIEDWIDGVPDEFYTSIKNIENQLIDKYKNLENEYKWNFMIINKSVILNDRKTFAIQANKYKYPSLLFQMKDNKDYTELIWKLIKPEFEKI